MKKLKKIRVLMSIMTAFMLCITTIPIMGLAEAQESQAVMQIEKKIISMNYSKGVTITPKYIVIHETDNTRAGANADAHFTYWNTNENANSSAHFVVDSTKVIQLLELNQRAWHVGDNVGYSEITNSNSIGIEICVNSDGDYLTARQKCIELVKYLLGVTGLTPDRVVRHNDASGKYCPRNMLDNPQLWIDLENAIIPFSTNKDIKEASGEITIDGKANEAGWEINQQMSQRTGDNSANFGTLWDSNYLYLFFNVVDANVVNTGAQYPWEYDSIEVYIDGDLTKGTYNNHTAQLVFGWGNNEVYLPNNSTHVNKSGIKYEMVKTAGGYAVEAAIPWSSIGGLIVQKDKKIGFNVHINNETSDVLCYVPPTTGGDWASSAGWSELTLVGTNIGSSLESIEITKQPTKKTYKVGETLDISNMVVTGKYSDKTTKIEKISATNVTGFDSSLPVESQTITVTVGGKSATFTVAIKNNDQAAPCGLTGVAPTSLANNDGKITGTTVAMEYKLSTALTYSPVTGTQITGLAAGTYNIRYAAKPGYNAGTTMDIVIPVYTTKTLESIAVTTLPTKMTYKVGEALDLTGLVVTGTYSDGTTKAENVTVQNVSGFDNTKPMSSLNLTITIGGKCTTFTVAVVTGTYTATIQATQGGQIINGASGSYQAGQEITIVATPQSGYIFYGWQSTGGGIFKQSNSLSTTFTMPAANVIITASFTPVRNGGGGGTSGSSIVTPKKPITPTETLPVKPGAQTQPNEKFIDLGEYNWAKDSINYLAEMGVINGTSENTFSPGANIIRADFTILLVRALKFTSNSTENFSDIQADAYYANELAIAKGCGIINGSGDNKFKPTDQISREDMMVIVTRALEKSGYKFSGVTDNELTSFSDANEISEYAKYAVALLVENNIIEGSNGKINPHGNASRAEIAVLIKRILDIKS